MTAQSGAARGRRARMVSVAGSGCCGWAGAVGVQEGELGCQPAGSAACAASDWAETSGAAVGVGCRERVRDWRARSTPLA